MNIKTRAKYALWRKFKDATRFKPDYKLDGKGYVKEPKQNLLPGIEFEAIQPDLQRGDGNELRGKFCAVHSSCALAVDSFGLFHENAADLMLLGQQGARHVEFERPLPIFPRGTPPNL